MSTATPNARFWVYLNCGPVKLTLRPGECIHWNTGGPHEEGWSREARRWTHDGDHVTEEMAEEGCDCDGRYSRHGTYHARLNDLRVNEPYDVDDPKVRYPDWERADSSQYDENAELANY